jgi:hypothetical protein
MPSKTDSQIGNELVEIIHDLAVITQRLAIIAGRLTPPQEAAGMALALSAKATIQSVIEEQSRPGGMLYGKSDLPSKTEEA